jgi:hypothetical protein
MNNKQDIIRTKDANPKPLEEYIDESYYHMALARL